MRVAIGMLLGLVCWISQARAADTPTLIIVDGTAQMSMKLGLQRKIDWVKSFIPMAVRRQGAGHPTSLWAYGTNSAAKCEDVRELVPLQNVPAINGSLESALQTIEPKAGRSPAFAAVRAALKSQTDANAPVSVLLIAGSGDDCGGDICSSARALQVLYPKAKLTVLGLAMSQQYADTYTCVTKAMGGSFTQIKSGVEFDRALRLVLEPAAPEQTAAQAKITPQAGAQKTKTDPAQQTAAANTSDGKDTKETSTTQTTPIVLPQPIVSDANLILSATFSANQVLEAGVTWRIYRIPPAGSEQERHPNPPVWAAGGGLARAKLSEGLYRVEAMFGLAQTSLELELGKDKVQKTVVFDAGMLSVETVMASSQPQAVSDVFYVLYRKTKDGGREEMARSSARPAFFYVNAGDYILKATSGLAVAETPVTVAAGKALRVTLPLNVGVLALKVTPPTPELTLTGVRHLVYAATNPKAGAVEDPLQILTQLEPTVLLPAGTYRVDTLYASAKTSTPVVITAGKTTTETVAFKLGEAKIAPPQGVAQDLSCALYPASDAKKDTPLARAAGSDIRFWVQEGVYDVQCKTGHDAKAAVSRAQVQVVSGQSQSVNLTN